MNKLKIKDHRKLTIVSLLYVLFAFFMLVVVTYAWFANTNHNNASLIQNVAAVEAEYQYFVYNDTSHTGSQELTLINNTTTTGEDLAYEFVPNPTVASFIDGYIAPGERFSFAIKITNVGSGTGYLEIQFGNVTSINYDLEINRIQNAIYFEVTKIVSSDGVTESDDIKDISPAQHFSSYFNGDIFQRYQMLRNIPLGYTSSDEVTIIFFDIVFDPTIYGEDEFGIPYTNSNIFMGQTITVNNIYMYITSNEVTP